MRTIAHSYWSLSLVLYYIDYRNSQSKGQTISAIRLLSSDGPVYLVLLIGISDLDVT